MEVHERTENRAEGDEDRPGAADAGIHAGNPVLLILILGTALSNAFNGSTTIGDIRVLYHNDGAEPALTEQWQAFMQEAERSSGMVFEQVEEGMDGGQEVRNNRYTGYVEMDGQGVRYDGNSRNSMENGLCKGCCPHLPTGTGCQPKPRRSIWNMRASRLLMMEELCAGVFHSRSEAAGFA